MKSRGLTGLLCAVLLVYGSLHAGWSLTRSRRVSHDMMNYIDVARHVHAGKGLGQSTIFYNPPLALPPVEFPYPFTIQPPIFPLAIAGLAFGGVPETDAALLLASVAATLVMGAAYLLMRRLYDAEAAILAVALLLVGYPVQRIGDNAWSEAPGLLFALLSAFFATRSRPGAAIAGAAGLCAGAAFATRFALAPALPIAWLALCDGGVRASRRALGFCTLGFASVAVPAFARTALVGDGPTGVLRHASPIPFNENLWHSTVLLLTTWLQRDGGTVQAGVTLAVLFLSLAIVRARQGGATVRGILIGGKRPVLAVWIVGYVLFIAALHSSRYFIIDARILVPAQIFLALLVAACVRAAISPGKVVIAVLLIGAVMIRAEPLVESLRTGRRAIEARAIRSSDRLLWVREHVNAETDLVIGDDTVDLGFYLGERSVSIYASPRLGHYLEYPQLCAIVVAARPRHPNIFLILRDGPGDETAERLKRGPFVTDLSRGRVDDYVGLVEIARVPDALVFRLEGCPGVEGLLQDQPRAQAQ